MSGWLRPEWPAPPAVRALVTTRAGGVSRGPYASFNLADHVGDDAAAVAENRRRLRACLPAEPLWLRQVHGSAVVDAAAAAPDAEADAALARQPGTVCAVLTADCLPVLLCSRSGRAVCAAHAGWRGLAGGVLEAAVAALGEPPEDLLAWLGPAIGPRAFEVGDEVRAVFLAGAPQAEAAFAPAAPGKWLADLCLLARQRLRAAGVVRIFGGGLCTFSDAARFYSYRRDGITGRMAALIWTE
ncbi:MAG TPA: peptidoglycan editing factor PgeF [Candidatus Desulfobacillus sp.]|nr:peptidoglycan editing factor PgeF [Candidatus Desulfobacillus sp.]